MFTTAKGNTLRPRFVVFRPSVKTLREVVCLLVLERQNQLATAIWLLVTQMLYVHLHAHTHVHSDLLTFSSQYNYSTILCPGPTHIVNSTAVLVNNISSKLAVS